MKRKQPINVLIVDDHPVVRAGYRHLLEVGGGFHVVAEADDGRQGYAAFCRHQPDVVIMDISLPHNSGLDVIDRILLREPDARVLVFSIHENPVMMQRARKAGARGFLSKRNAPRQMVDALQRIARGGEYFDPQLELEAAGQTDPMGLLTQREFEVFLMLAQGLGIHRVAELLHISSKTAGVHQTRIMHKVNAQNPAHLARLAIRHGLIVA